MAEPMPAKFIGFFRLIDACQSASCPVCRCLAADTRQYLDTLLYEHVNDPETRARLHASWGFCNWHAGMLRETTDPAFGSAILSEDLLRVLMRRFERSTRRAVTRETGPWQRLLALFGRPRSPAIVRVHRRRAPCPACSRLAEAEERYVETALQFAQDPQFERAYRKSQGLCVPHALCVACVGPFKRGKSALINALVGQPLLPTRVVPVTSVVTVVRHGAQVAARLRFGDRGWEQLAALTRPLEETRARVALIEQTVRAAEDALCELAHRLAAVQDRLAGTFTALRARLKGAHGAHGRHSGDGLQGAGARAAPVRGRSAAPAGGACAGCLLCRQSG